MSDAIVAGRKGAIRQTMCAPQHIDHERKARERREVVLRFQQAFRLPEMIQTRAQFRVLRRLALPLR